MKAYKNLSQIVTLESAYKKDGRRVKNEDLSIIEDGTIVFDEDEPPKPSIRRNPSQREANQVGD